MHITTGDIYSIGIYCPNSLSSPNLCPDSIYMIISVTHITTGDIYSIGIPMGHMSPVVLSVTEINMYMESGQRLGKLKLLGQ
jgi:hypothetical protein